MYKLLINIKICPTKYPKPTELAISKGQFSAVFYKPEPVNNKKPKAELMEIYAARKQQRADSYQKLMNDNHWTRADLARHLGVSRAWVSKVLKTH
ncbi:MAG: helix-turn-helix transcriptional regulator [Calditrichia bacterium]